jgi:hypothetical protein
VLLEEVENRVTFIGEEFHDLEVAHDRIHELYLAVLIAIANGQCEDASPRAFAKAVIGLEFTIHSGPAHSPEFWHELEERLAGRRPPAFIADATPALKTKGPPKKKTPTKRAKAKPQRGKPKKRR